MNAVRLLVRFGLAVSAASCLLPGQAAAQATMKDFEVHHSPLLAITMPVSFVQVEPAGEDHAQVRLLTREAGELRIVAREFAVTMAHRGFTLTAVGSVTMSGAYTLEGEKVALVVSEDGSSVLRATRATRGVR